MGAWHLHDNTNVIIKACDTINAVKRGDVTPNLTKFPADARLISSSLPCLPERLRLPWICVFSLDLRSPFSFLRWRSYCLEMRRALQQSCCVYDGVLVAGDSDSF